MNSKQGCLGVVFVMLVGVFLAFQMGSRGPSVSAVLTLKSASSGASLSQVQGSPSLSAAFLDQVLAAAHSPVAGHGQAVYDLSRQYGLDDAFVLAFFGHESTFGTVGAAVQTHSWGNIVCTSGFASCLGRYRSYPSFLAGLEDFCRLLVREYFSRGLTTVETIIPVYAPSSENDVAGYIQAVQSFVSSWRSGNIVV